MCNDLVERDLNKLGYVGKLGGNDCSVSFMREKRGCTCRYHMGYTRGYERRGGDWAPLASLFADKVETQNDILEKQLVEGDLSEREKKGFESNRAGNDQQAMGNGERSYGR